MGVNVWIVTAECGDYYCGCGVGHLLGVATTEEQAERLRSEGERAEYRYPHLKDARWSKPFRDVTVEKITTDELRVRDAITFGGDVELRVPPA